MDGVKSGHFNHRPLGTLPCYRQRCPEGLPTNVHHHGTGQHPAPAPAIPPKIGSFNARVIIYITTNIGVMMMFMNVRFSGSFIQSAARNSLPSGLHSTNFPVTKVIVMTRTISFYILITLLFIMNISLPTITQTWTTSKCRSRCRTNQQ